MGALESAREDAGVPGLSVVECRAGVRASFHSGVAAAGQPDPLLDASRFEVSCLMKFFMSLVAQKMLRRGQLNLAAPLGELLPELAGSPAGERISLSNLLSHTSGYRGLDVTDARIKWGHSWPKLVEQLRGEALLFPPGAVFSYEHSEHVLLGGLLQRISSKSVDQLLRDELLEPLGITVGRAKEDPENGCFVGQHVPTQEPRKFAPVRQPAFSDFWRASLPDMTIRLHDVLTVGEWLLDDANAWLHTELDRPVVDLPPQAKTSNLAELIPKSFGHVCGRYEGGMLGHNGSVLGQTVALRIDVARRAVYAVGVNAWVPHLRDRAIQLISGQASRETVPSDSKHESGVDTRKLSGPFSFAELAGTYDGGFARQITVESSDDRNLSMLVGAPRSRQRRITVTRRSDGTLCEFGRNQHVSCAFTAHPTDGSPVLHLGVHSYRRRL